jgi:N-acetylglucosaminyldiphosphoundecaprenol N-acetyl-beta-D-mannosaminyltransferase
MTLAEYSPIERPMDKRFVMGLPIHQGADYVDWLLQRLSQRQGAHVVTLNAEMCIQAEQDLDLQRIVQQAELVIPDGAGIELYFRLLCHSKVKRYPGIELAANLLERLPSTHSVVFFGGAPGISAAAAEQWQQQSPQLTVACAQHGFLSDEEQTTFQTQLKTTQPSVILVGLGVPRQEFWIQAHRHLCPNAIWIGVGGSFDIWAGIKERAPGWLRNNHLEWLYRLYKEPWRWQRMLALPKFAWRALLHRWGWVGK